ncbi:MAG: Uma2 family endonuclease, partial [Chloroflexota bacterium]|nr:Uma2 family endonuclease [Chloroflexota bacterium]
MDLGVVIEVSDVTLRTDRTLKQRIYAKARIPVYWLL